MEQNDTIASCPLDRIHGIKGQCDSWGCNVAPGTIIYAGSIYSICETMHGDEDLSYSRYIRNADDGRIDGNLSALVLAGYLATGQDAPGNEESQSVLAAAALPGSTEESLANRIHAIMDDRTLLDVFGGIFAGAIEAARKRP